MTIISEKFPCCVVVISGTVHLILVLFFLDVFLNAGGLTVLTNTTNATADDRIAIVAAKSGFQRVLSYGEFGLIALGFIGLKFANTTCTAFLNLALSISLAYGSIETLILAVGESADDLGFKQQHIWIKFGFELLFLVLYLLSIDFKSLRCATNGYRHPVFWGLILSILLLIVTFCVFRFTSGEELLKSAGAAREVYRDERVFLITVMVLQVITPTYVFITSAMLLAIVLSGDRFAGFMANRWLCISITVQVFVECTVHTTIPLTGELGTKAAEHPIWPLFIVWVVMLAVLVLPVGNASLEKSVKIVLEVDAEEASYDEGQLLSDSS